MQQEIEIRDITRDDTESLIKLFDNVWPESAGTYIGKTKWMLSNPVIYGVCSCHNDEIIGSRLSFQVNIYFGNQRIHAVQYGNSCVHSDYRRLGIFSKMNKAFLKKFFEENDNDLIYNVSVEASKLAYQKLGWKYINTLSKLFFFPNTWNFLIKSKFNIKYLSGTTIYDIKEIPSLDTFDLNLLDIREQYFREKSNLHTYYNEEFFRWRLNSDTNIALFNVDGLGTILYKIGTKNNLRVITIGEVFLYKYNKKNLKQITKLLTKQYQVDFLEILITENHPLFRFYKRTGFLANPFKKYLNLGVKVISEEMRRICLEPKNWAISSLDIDTF